MRLTNNSDWYTRTFEEGEDAYNTGLSKNACLHTPGSRKYRAWIDGFEAAEFYDHECIPIGEYLVVGILIIIVLSACGLLSTFH